MGNCQICQKNIEDKYIYCAECNIKAKTANTQDNTNQTLKQISQHLKHINWNLGIISQHLTGKKDIIKKIEKEMQNE